MRRLPRALAPGSRAALVAPSSPSPRSELEAACRAIEELGLVPIVMPSCERTVAERGFLAGESDEAKVRDLHDAFADDTIGCVFCLRGGSGAGRLIEMLDEELIANGAKLFAGFSDITMLHCFIAARCGFITLHAPCASSGAFLQGGETLASFMRAASDPAPLGRVGGALTTITGGTARGELVGGNLSVLCTTIGTRAELDTAGKIVLLEDIGEAPYRVDRMLSHLLNAGKLRDAAGIVLGEFTDCGVQERYPARGVPEVVRDLLAPLGIPCAEGLEVGHGSVNLTVPLGADAVLDATEGSLSFPRPSLARRAFTLVETVLAMLIAMTAIVGVGTEFSNMLEVMAMHEDELAARSRLSSAFAIVRGCAADAALGLPLSDDLKAAFGSFSYSPFDWRSPLYVRAHDSRERSELRAIRAVLTGAHVAEEVRTSDQAFAIRARDLKQDDTLKPLSGTTLDPANVVIIPDALPGPGISLLTAYPSYAGSTATLPLRRRGTDEIVIPRGAEVLGMRAAVVTTRQYHIVDDDTYDSFLYVENVDAVASSRQPRVAGIADARFSLDAESRALTVTLLARGDRWSPRIATPGLPNGWPAELAADITEEMRHYRLFAATEVIELEDL